MITKNVELCENFTKHLYTHTNVHIYKTKSNFIAYIIVCVTMDYLFVILSLIILKQLPELYLLTF